MWVGCKRRRLERGKEVLTDACPPRIRGGDNGIVSAQGLVSVMSENRLLVVDDEPDIGEFIRTVGEGEGFAVRVTSTAKDFLREFDEFSPTAICLDVVMPDTDGIELLKYLADRKCTASILVISGYSKLYLTSAENLGEAFGLPYVKTLMKPLGLATLREALRDVRIADA